MHCIRDTEKEYLCEEMSACVYGGERESELIHN